MVLFPVLQVQTGSQAKPDQSDRRPGKRSSFIVSGLKPPSVVSRQALRARQVAVLRLLERTHFLESSTKVSGWLKLAWPPLDLVLDHRP